MVRVLHYDLNGNLLWEQQQDMEQVNVHPHVSVASDDARNVVIAVGQGSSTKLVSWDVSGKHRWTALVGHGAGYTCEAALTCNSAGGIQVLGLLQVGSPGTNSMNALGLSLAGLDFTGKQMIAQPLGVACGGKRVFLSRIDPSGDLIIVLTTPDRDLRLLRCGSTASGRLPSIKFPQSASVMAEP